MCVCMCACGFECVSVKWQHLGKVQVELPGRCLDRGQAGQVAADREVGTFVVDGGV